MAKKLCFCSVVFILMTSCIAETEDVRLLDGTLVSSADDETLSEAESNTLDEVFGPDALTESTDNNYFGAVSSCLPIGDLEDYEGTFFSYYDAIQNDDSEDNVLGVSCSLPMLFTSTVYGPDDISHVRIYGWNRNDDDSNNFCGALRVRERMSTGWSTVDICCIDDDASIGWCDLSGTIDSDQYYLEVDVGIPDYDDNTGNPSRLYGFKIYLVE